MERSSSRGFGAILRAVWDKLLDRLFIFESGLIFLKVSMLSINANREDPRGTEHLLRAYAPMAIPEGSLPWPSLET